jgi:hypothetical protein
MVSGVKFVSECKEYQNQKRNKEQNRTETSRILVRMKKTAEKKAVMASNIHKYES